MQNQSTLTKASIVVFVMVALLFSIVTYLRRPQADESRVKAATENGSSSHGSDKAAVTASPTAPDVTVNGQHIDVPVNGSRTVNLSGGGEAHVTSNQADGSSTITTSPNGSIQISTQMSSDNSSTNSNTHVFSSSSSQSSNWSQANVFSTSTNNVQVTR